MQAHAPKHHGGLIEYLERHLLVTFVTLAVLFAGVLAAIVITNTNDNAEPASVPEVAAPAPVTDFRYLEQNTELPPYTGAVEQPSITSSSHPGMGEGWVGGAARPAVVSPARNYPLAWARFLEVNGVVGALTAPVISVEQQRFLEENLYLPGDGASVEDVSGPRDITAYSHPGMGEGWVGNGMPADVIVVPDVVAHVPDRAGDGVLGTQQAGISAGPVVVTGDPADITAYSHSGMGEGWLGHGK